MKYFPILLSKAGELSALRKLSQNVKDETTPVIQILDNHFDNVSSTLVTEWVFQNNSVIFDFSLLTNVNSDLLAIENLIRFVTLAGVNVIPAIDLNSSPQYTQLIQNLYHQLNFSICLRTSGNSGGFVNFNNHVNNLALTLDVPQNQLLLLIDFGLVGANNFINVSNTAIAILNGIQNPGGYKDLIIASGSFPQDLGGLIPNNVHLLQRYEWSIWNMIQNNSPLQVKYSDYGTKHPIYAEANFLGSCSIKYSTTLNFVIYRGEVPQNNPLGNGQYINFSKQLVVSQYYSGMNFSWGDAKIHLMSTQNINPPHNPGNAKTWVEISQNHHITLLESLL